MFRRRFLQLITLASAGMAAPLQTLASTARRTVTYRVQGFTCITCATGLDTMLGHEKGIIASKSTYPEGKVTVAFDPDRTTEAAIKAFITELGFAVDAELKSRS